VGTVHALQLITEFKSLDDNVLTVKIGTEDVVGVCDMREIEIKV
jgi:hypothetical protein